MVNDSRRGILGEISTWLRLLGLVVLAAEGVILAGMGMTPEEHWLHAWYPIAMLAFLLAVVAGFFFDRFHTSRGGSKTRDATVESMDHLEVGRSPPKQVEGLEHFQKWDTSHVRSLMKSAKTRIWILQTWFPGMEDDIHEWRFEHPKDVKVRILMTHESNPAVLERVRFRPDFREDKDDKQLKSHIKQVADACEAGIREKLKDDGINSVIARYEQGMPFGPIYIIDDDAIFGIYPPHQNCNYAPMLRVGTETRTGRLMRESFNTFWSSTPEGKRSPLN